MFVKLIVLILALGSTGIGVLSVRQSRLVASNEMTQSRLRARQIDQKAMELRMQIAQRITPDQIRMMLGEEINSTMVDQTQRRIDLLDPIDPEPLAEEIQSQPGAVTIEPNYWILDDGTRVYILDGED